MLCPSCRLLPTGLTGPSQSIKSVFQGLHARGPAWGNHLDGDGACREPSGPLSSYCRSTPYSVPYQVPRPSSNPVPSTLDRRAGVVGGLTTCTVINYKYLLSQATTQCRVA